MHDRASAKPPSFFTRHSSMSIKSPSLNAVEKAMDQYLAETETRHKGEERLRRSQDTNLSYDAGIEATKPSGMYKFGKALVNAFNPMAVWHTLNGTRKEKDVEQVDAQKAVLQERQALAEKTYAELKESGFKGTQGPFKARRSVEVPVIKHEETERGFVSAPHRDSGIDVDGYSSATERKRDGIVFDADDKLKIPAQLNENRRSVSSTSDVNSTRKSSLHLRRPSLEGLKKVKSHLQLPLNKRQTTISAESEFSSHEDGNSKGLQKKTSRKDLQKQQKLSKRVSDLESKLETARRDLRLAMDDAPPVPDLPPKLTRKPFKPGALATLPSESLLQGGVAHANSDITTGPRIVDAAISHATTDIIEQALGVYPESTKTTGHGSAATAKEHRKLLSSRKRKSPRDNEDKRFRPVPGNLDDEDEWLPAKRAPKKRARESSKQVGPSDKRPPQTPPKDPKFASPSVFHPNRLNSAKIRVMHSQPTLAVPSGRLSNDKSTRSMASLNNISESKLTTDHTSVTHLDQRSPPVFLPPPRSLSPVKIPAQDHAVTQSAGLSASPKRKKVGDSFAQRMAQSKAKEVVEDAVMVDPSEEVDVPPVPIVPDDVEGERAKVETGGRKVREQGEYEWPEDIF